MTDRESDETERIPFGEETEERYGEGSGGVLLYAPRDTPHCPDCQAERDELHEVGCDTEQCPICHTQLLGDDHWDEVIEA